MVTLKDESGGLPRHFEIGVEYWRDERRLRSWNWEEGEDGVGVRTSPRNCQCLHLREIFIFLPTYYGVLHFKMKFQRGLFSGYRK